MYYERLMQVTGLTKQAGIMDWIAGTPILGAPFAASRNIADSWDSNKSLISNLGNSIGGAAKGVFGIDNAGNFYNPIARSISNVPKINNMRAQTDAFARAQDKQIRMRRALTSAQNPMGNLTIGISGATPAQRMSNMGQRNQPWRPANPMQQASYNPQQQQPVAQPYHAPQGSPAPYGQQTPQVQQPNAQFGQH